MNLNFPHCLHQNVYLCFLIASLEELKTNQAHQCFNCLFPHKFLLQRLSCYLPPPFPFPRFSTTTVSSPFKVKQQKEPHTETVTNSFSPAPVERSPIPPLSEPNTYEDQLISERAAQTKQEIIKQSTSPLLHDFESCSPSSSPPMSPPLKEQSHKPSTKDSDDDGYAKSLRNVAKHFFV